VDSRRKVAHPAPVTAPVGTVDSPNQPKPCRGFAQNDPVTFEEDSVEEHSWTKAAQILVHTKG